jgi:hypothetical protein
MGMVQGGRYKQLDLAEKILSEELGREWFLKVRDMPMDEKVKLADMLRDKGIRNPVVISKVLRISGRLLSKTVRSTVDENYVMRLRETSIQSSKPILAKEIQDYAWSHNLYHDVGKYVCLELAKYVQFDDEDLNDSQRAFMKITGVFRDLLRFAEDVKQVEKLRAEKEAMDVLLTVATDYLEKAVKKLNEYYCINKMYQEMFSKSLCSSCRSKVLKWIIMCSITGNLQTLSRGTISPKQ